MKELTSFAFNSAAILNAGKLEPSIEAALILSEPGYIMTNDGVPARVRTVDTVRFVASPVELRRLAKQIARAADEVEEEVFMAIQRQCPACNTKPMQEAKP